MSTPSRSRLIPTSAVATVIASCLAGCSGESPYASSDGKHPPYILKDDCTFSIVSDNGRSTISSFEVTGVPNDAASASISLGEFSITVSDCVVVANSHELPIYEN